MYHHRAPWCLTNHCTPVSGVVFYQRLCLTSIRQVSVPRYWLSTYGRQAFCFWSEYLELIARRLAVFGVFCGQ